MNNNNNFELCNCEHTPLKPHTIRTCYTQIHPILVGRDLLTCTITVSINRFDFMLRFPQSHVFDVQVIARGEGVHLVLSIARRGTRAAHKYATQKTRMAFG